MKKNNIWKAWVAAGAIVAVSTVGGLMAYFTDTQEKVNHFTVGKIDIELQEPEWDKKPDEDGNQVPDEAEHMTPMQKITKDPQIQNTGVNDAYVFMTVEIPCRNVVTAKPDGTKNPLALTPLYSYEKNVAWKYLGSYKVIDDGGTQTGVKHLYAYVEEAGKCKAVKPQEMTTPLFTEVTFANIVENEKIEEQSFDINIQAYGIQTSNLNGGTEDAEEIWKVISNQNELGESFEK